MSLQPQSAPFDLPPRPRALTWLSVVSLLLFAVTLGMALFFVPTEATQGDVQRIFYIHVPAFIGASVALAITLVAGIAYLRTRQVRWDALAVAGVEVGLALGLFNLVSGMIWARPIWNTWWTWSPRLTWAAIMVLAYAAYLILRSAVEDPDRRARFASVYGIVAFSTVIMVFIIPRLTPDIHPIVVGPSVSEGEGGFNMSARMGMTFGANIVTFILMALTLVWHRFRLEQLSRHVMALKVRLFSR